MSPPRPFNESDIKNNESGTNNLTPAHILWRIHIFGWRIHYEIWWIHFLTWRIHLSLRLTTHFRRVRHDTYMSPSPKKMNLAQI